MGQTHARYIFERNESDTENLMIRLRDKTVDTAGERIGIEGYWNTVPAGDIEFELRDTSSGASDIVFSPHSSGGTKTEAMRISYEGEVGIGRTPTETLDIYRSGANANILVSRDSMVLNVQAQNSWGVVGTNSSHNLGLKTGGSIRLTCDTSGNVGINDTTPSTTLDVNGTISGTGHRGLSPYYFKANINNSSSTTGRKDLSTTTADVTIDWYTTTYTDNSSSAYFSHSTSNRSRIVVEKDGLYTVNFNIAWDNTGTNRATIYASLWINGVERDETKTYGYSRGATYGDKNNCVGSYTERFEADDYIEIKCRGIDFDDAGQAVYTINDESSIQVYGWPDRGT